MQDSANVLTTVEPSRATAELAGFWRRVAALCADGVLLGACGLAIAFFSHERLVELGSAATVIGFAISLAYFGLFDGAAGGGRTPGKRLLGIRVVTAEGAPLGTGRAVIRTAVLELPWLLNGFDLGLAPWEHPFASAALAYVASLIVFGLGGAIVLLAIVNRRTRQSVHDLAARSFVVRGAPLPVQAPPLAPRALAAAYAWSGLVALGAAAGIAWMAQSASTALRPLAVVAGVPGVRSAKILHVTHRSGGAVATELRIEVSTADPDAAALATRVARAYLAEDPHPAEAVLQVVVHRGFDLFFASRSTTTAWVHPVAEWRADTRL